MRRRSTNRHYQHRRAADLEAFVPSRTIEVRSEAKQEPFQEELCGDQRCAKAYGGAVALLGLDHLGQLLAQLWAIVMTMHCDSVLHCRVYKFLFGIGRNRDRAVHLAWVITTIHKQSGHLGLPGRMILSVHPCELCLALSNIKENQFGRSRQ